MEGSEVVLPGQIEKSDINPNPPEVGGTKIVLQRHGNYERSQNSSDIGSLTQEGVEDTYALGKDFLGELFNSIPEKERKDVDLLVVASDTQYEGRGRRSMETAEQVIRAINEELEARGLEESQLLNNAGNLRGNGGPRPMHRLREPQMLDNSPEFLEFLKEKYGDRSLDFWIAFEEDKEKGVREEMGAEGPDDITDRTKFVVKALTRYSNYYHAKHPNKRLIIWAATHYDTISPYVKREILGTGKEKLLGVNYGAGISINLDKNGQGSTTLGGKEYQISGQ